MKTISSKEINDLYKKVGLNPKENYQVNTNFNKGLLTNKLIGIEALSKGAKKFNFGMKQDLEIK